MELHQLMYVIQVAKHHHFSKAANDLCITQPTLSNQIIKLEEEIGVRLFDRRTRSVKSTAAGEEFVIYAKKILGDIDRLRQAMQDHTSLKKGQIKIGSVPTTAQLGLTNNIALFQNCYPGLHIHITEAGSRHLINLLHTSEIDIAFLIPPLDCDTSLPIKFHPLIPGEVVLITSKDHPIANKKLINLKEVAQERFVFLPRNWSIHEVALKACQSSGFEPDIACECSQLETMFGLVSSGFGIGFSTSQVAATRSDIAIVTFKPLIQRTTCLALLNDSYHTSAIIAFRDFILDAFGNNSDFSSQSNQ